MNLNLTKEEFNEVIMLYLVNLVNTTDLTGIDEDSSEFDLFLKHVASRPLGKLKTSYFREDSKVKLSHKRMMNKIEKGDNVRLII